MTARRLGAWCVLVVAVFLAAGCSPRDASPSPSVTVTVHGPSEEATTAESPAPSASPAPSPAPSVTPSAGAGEECPAGNGDCVSGPDPGDPVVNPGEGPWGPWAADTAADPPPGVTADELRTAAGNATAFLRALWTHGAGDEGPMDATVAALPWSTGVMEARLEDDLARFEAGDLPTRWWQEDVAEQVRWQVRVLGVRWADWSHGTDYVTAEVVYETGAAPWPGGDWPPFTRSQYQYVTLTRKSGWLVEDSVATPPAGYVPCVMWPDGCGTG